MLFANKIIIHTSQEFLKRLVEMNGVFMICTINRKFKCLDVKAHLLKNTFLII